MQKRIVIFIHGIVGHPRFFSDYIQLVPEGDEICPMLLAGHGGSVDDFSRATMGQWKEQVERQLEEAEDRFDEVVLVGHSMGTLFCLQQLAKREKISGVFLLAPPLRLRVRISDQWQKMKIILSSKGKSSADLFDGVLGVDPDPRFWKYIGWTRNYLSLLCEIRRTRKLLRSMPMPKCPVNVFLSAQDELVSVKSAEELLSLGADVKILKHSTHFTYSEEDYRELMTTFSALLARV